MSDLLEKYLWYLHEFGMPSMGLMPARQPAGYKQAPGPVNAPPQKDDKDEEEVEEYTSYNPHGSGYGMMMQRWAYTQSDPMARGIDSSNAHPSQKPVKKDIEITVNTGKKKKEKKDEEKT